MAKKRTQASTPVIQAVLARDESGLAGALKRAADVDETDADGRTALHHAAIQGELRLVNLLIESGARVEAPDKDEWTALHYASQNYETDVAVALLAAGAPVDAVDAHGNTPLARAVFESRGRGTMIQILLAAGADEHRVNNHGTSPAALAARIANFDVAQWLRR